MPNYYDKDGRYNGETNDCVVIAVSNAFDISYQEAHSHCEKLGRKFNKGFNTRKAFLLTTGKRSELWGHECIYIKRPNMTLKTFIQNFPKGTYVVRTGGHASVVKDGVSMNNSNMRSIISYYIKITKMTTQEMRSYAASKDIKVIGLTNAQLQEKINIPVVGEEVFVMKTKNTEPVKAVFKGYFKCKKTNVFYAKLQGEDKKRFIKQLIKVQRNEN